MRILPGLLWGILNLLAIGLDVCIFFLLIRLILLWRKINWLEQFNNIGKRLIDTIIANANRLHFRASQKQLSNRSELLVGLAALSLMRFLLCGIAGLM